MNPRFRAALTVAVTTAVALLGAALAAEPAEPGMKTATFDRDPEWDGHNNRSARKAPPLVVRQDFGFSNTAHAGGKPGEIGGFLSQAAEPAYYGQVIDPITFDAPWTASGKLTVRKGGTPDDTGAHLLLGLFNSRTINEWRTPNTIAIRISARGDAFSAYVEYCTSKWRAGGDSTPFPLRTDPFHTGDTPHEWSLAYDPKGNDGKGVVTATIDGKTAFCNLSDGHKADGATFDRFGILNVMKDGGDGSEFYVDDVTINGKRETFDNDPNWDAKDNRRTYPTRSVRPRFDFGYSDTNFAGGKSKGEIGGQTFRGDCRYGERLACYGDAVGPLKLDRPIKASGKIALTRGVTDSTALFGFYNARSSMEVADRQDSGTPKSFLGVAIEGPSAEGFYFYPAYRVDGDGEGSGGRASDPLRIHPDGKSHDWSLVYDPAGDGGKGTITISLDRKSVSAPLAEGHKEIGATLDRFGIITTWIDGNGQHVYLDDLTYTAEQGGPEK
jgi:hypothetical protein